MEKNVNKLPFKFKKRKRYPMVTLRKIVDGYAITEEQWRWIAVHQKLDAAFIADYYENFKQVDLYKHHIVEENFLEEHLPTSKEAWRIVCKHQHLSEEFMQRHENEISWHDCCFHQNMSEDFMYKNRDRIVWADIVEKKYITEDLMYRVADCFTPYCWFAAMKQCRVSFDFIKNNIKYLSRAYRLRLWYYMEEKKFNPEDPDGTPDPQDFNEEKRNFVRDSAELSWSEFKREPLKYLNRKNKDMPHHVGKIDYRDHNKFLINMVQHHNKRKYHTNGGGYRQFHLEEWTKVSRIWDLSEEFIERFQEHLDWSRMSEYQYLSEKFIARHKDEVDWRFISANQELSPEFVNQFKDYIDFDALAYNLTYKGDV